uniref:Uncharacterized protein n=1 Tax=Arundo donax TaxID=35708 RepID=A0A0A9GWD1_ARUDO
MMCFLLCGLELAYARRTNHLSLQNNPIMITVNGCFQQGQKVPMIKELATELELTIDDVSLSNLSNKSNSNSNSTTNCTNH